MGVGSGQEPRAQPEATRNGDGDGNFAEAGRGERGRAHAQTARAVVTRPAPHAELAANGVVECASGRALRSTAEARETIAW